MTATTIAPFYCEYDELPAIDTAHRKVITWDTNFNQKLGCDAMVHIDLAPMRLPLRTEMDSTAFEIRTKDNSYPPTLFRLYDFSLLSFQRLTDRDAFCSHGTTAMKLAETLFEKHAPEFSWTTEMAMYFYLKIL